MSEDDCKEYLGMNGIHTKVFMTALVRDRTQFLTNNKTARRSSYEEQVLSEGMIPSGKILFLIYDNPYNPK